MSIDAITTTRNRWLLHGAIAVGYALLSEFGLQLRLPPSGIAAFWPAAGLAVGAMTTVPRSERPWVAVDIFVACLSANLLHNSASISVAFAVANVLETILFVSVYGAITTRFRGFVFIAILAMIAAGVVGSAAGGFAAAASIAIIVDGPLLLVWRDWLISDLMGVLIVAPVLLLGRDSFRAQTAAPTEFGAIVGALVLIVGTVFGVYRGTSVVMIELGYLALPVLMWAALRTDVRRTASLGIGVALAATWLTAHGRGPFVLTAGSERDPLVAVQIFLVMMSLSSVLMALVAARSREAESVAIRQQSEIRELGIANEVSRLEAELHRGRRLESVGRLAGGITHDFNNLLGVILNYSAALSRSAEPASKSQRDADQIYQAAQRGSDLTRQLLLYSRSESSEPDRTDIERLVIDIVGMIQGTMRSAVSIVVTTHGPAWSMVDRSRVEQALVNLLINARDAIDHVSPDGFGEIQVTLDTTSAGHRLTVLDNGCGMSDAVLAQATEPFFTTKPPGKGSGLGLATAYATAAEFGGRMDVSSTLGEGTAIVWELPVSEAPTS